MGDRRPNFRVFHIQTCVFVLCAHYTKNENFNVCIKDHIGLKGKTTDFTGLPKPFKHFSTRQPVLIIVFCAAFHFYTFQSNATQGQFDCKKYMTMMMIMIRMTRHCESPGKFPDF